MSNTGDHKEGKVYELGYLLLPSIPEDKLSDVVNSIKKVISEEGAKELDSEDPFLYDLAYSMSKTVGASKYVVNDAYIGWVKFEAESAQVEAINDKVEKMDEMLRFLLIKVPRETEFTFEKARKALEEKENQRNMPERESDAEVQPEAAPKEASESKDAAVVE